MHVCLSPEVLIKKIQKKRNWRRTGVGVGWEECPMLWPALAVTQICALSYQEFLLAKRMGG